MITEYVKINSPGNTILYYKSKLFFQSFILIIISILSFSVFSKNNNNLQLSSNVIELDKKIENLKIFIDSDQYPSEEINDLKIQLKNLLTEKQKLESRAISNDQVIIIKSKEISQPQKSVLKKLPPTKLLNVTPSSNVEDKLSPEIVVFNYSLEEINEVNVVKEIIQGNLIDKSRIISFRMAGKEVKLDSKLQFSEEVNLNEGMNEISLTAVDSNGNKTEKVLKFSRTPITKINKFNLEYNTDAVERNRDFGKFFALVIGNNNYLYIPKLDTAVNDAKDVADILKSKYEFEVKILLNAKRSEIMDAINEYKSTLNSNDNLLIFYAGHGHKDETAYWLPIDAKVDSSTEWIQAETLTIELKKMLPNHILIISDSCYSGELSRSITPNLKLGSRNNYLKKIFAQKSRTLIASGGNEPVADSGGGNHSIFTKAFVEALSDPPDQIYTDEELFDRNIKEIVAGNSEQTPQYRALRNSGHENGSFIFFKKN